MNARPWFCTDGHWKAPARGRPADRPEGAAAMHGAGRFAAARQSNRSAVSTTSGSLTSDDSVVSVKICAA